MERYKIECIENTQISNEKLLQTLNKVGNSYSLTTSIVANNFTYLIFIKN